MDPIPSIQLPEPYTQFTGDSGAPDAHFNSSFPKSQQKSPLVGECTFSHLKKRKKINIWFQYTWKPINSSPDSFFSTLLFLQFSPHLWQMVNRNNGVWLLGGQGAASGENKATDESAWAGITQASMPLTSLRIVMDKRLGGTLIFSLFHAFSHTHTHSKTHRYT